jgi:hypothetical protein
MKLWRFCCFVLFVLVGLLATATAQEGEEVKEFPPGVFNNGQKYHLADYKGKVVFLFFFDPGWPEGKTIVSQKFSAEADQFAVKLKDKPYKLFAVGAGMPQAAFAYARLIGIKGIPVFADNLGIMQKRFGVKIAGQKTVRLVIVGPTGLPTGDEMMLQSSGPNEISYSKDVIQRALDKNPVEPKYNVKEYDTKLEPAIQAFEWSDYATGMKLLGPYRKSKSKTVAAAAGKLYDEVKKEGESWKAEADQAAEDKPVKAYDLYKKIAKTFPGTEMSKEVAPALKKLSANKTVLKELEARKDLAKLEAQLAQMAPAQSKQAAAACKLLAKRHPGTPTAEHAKALAADLGS